MRRWRKARIEGLELLLSCAQDEIWEEIGAKLFDVRNIVNKRLAEYSRQGLSHDHHASNLADSGTVRGCYVLGVLVSISLRDKDETISALQHQIAALTTAKEKADPASTVSCCVTSWAKTFEERK